MLQEDSRCSSVNMSIMQLGWGKTCLTCHGLKKGCVIGRAELSGEVHKIHEFSQHSVSVPENNWRILKHDGSHITKIMDHFVPLDDNREESRDGVENKEEHDTEMERIGAEMVDIAMDETLQ